ncbi:MAG: hypothetical protein ACOY0T_15535 [Myxococcota bacterium]
MVTLRKPWSRGAIGLASALGATLWLAACATSSETRSAPDSAPASVAPPATPPPVGEKGAVDDADFTTLEQAEAALDRARADLDRLALREPVRISESAAGAAAPGPAPATAPAPGAPPSQSASRARADRSEKKAGNAAPSAPAKPKTLARPEPEAEAAAAVAAEAPADRDQPAEAAKSENPCDTGCKAFASLLRAKAAVCRLDTPGGTRCTRAEDIAREAEVRVRACGCQQ